jgi:hypothetical protein
MISGADNHPIGCEAARPAIWGTAVAKRATLKLPPFYPKGVMSGNS